MLKQSIAVLLLTLPLFCAANFPSFASTTDDGVLIAKKEKGKKGGVNWQSSLPAAFDQAKREGRPVFAHVGATWCGPCQFMEHHIFPDRKVQDFLSKNYVNAVLDRDTREGAELVSQYQMRGIPALFVFDSNGHLKGKCSGAPNKPAVFIHIVEKMSDGEINTP